MFIVLGVAVFVSAMFGSLSLGGLIHFEIMDGREREATFSEEEPDSKGSAGVDFDNFFAEGLLVEPPFDERGLHQLCFASRGHGNERPCGI